MRRLLLLLAALVLPLSVAPAARAAQAEQRSEDAGRLVLVLDSSGSMKEPVPGGGTKIAAAKSALGRVVDQLPDEADVGIRVFGATVFSRKDPGACTDTQNVVPVGPLDRTALTQAVADYRPYGETPIGNALRGAAKDLGPAARGETRTVVLLSDGEPTCAPDPCQVAAQLSRKGIDVKINVVGLDVSGKARRVLQCIARAGNGTYYDARTADELASSLVKVSVRDLRLFRLSGTRVSGGRSSEQALPLEPGTYVDTSLPDEQKRYYVVDKPAGGGVSVGVLMRPPGGDENWATTVYVYLNTSDGTSCARGYSLSFQVLGLTPITSTATEYQPYGSAAVDDDECAAADQLVATVHGRSAPTDFRLQVRTYPRVTNLAQLPRPLGSEEGPWVRRVSIPTAGTRVPVAGGVSPDDAPALEPGASYSDTVRPSEQLVYKVAAGYGQAIRVSARLGTSAQADRVLDLLGTSARFHSISALGQAYPDSRNLSTPGVTGYGRYDGKQPLVMTAVVPPIQARNIASPTGEIRATTHDGSYYFVLGLGREVSAEASRYEAPVTLRAELVGEVR